MKKRTAGFLVFLLFGATALAVEGRAQQLQPDEAHADNALIKQALAEIDHSLDAYFQLFDDEDLLLFVTAVRHAARGRLLLEQYLGDDIDDLSVETAEQEPIRHDLALIAHYAKKFTGEEAREMWRRDHAFDHFENAKMTLATWDVMVQGTKKHLAGMQ